MWRRFVVISFTLVSCAAIPRASAKRELQLLLRLPQLESPLPLGFDRNRGFVIFPNESDSAAEAASLLAEAKGTPKDAPLFLEAAQACAGAANIADSIRNLARAAELFNRQMESAPSAVAPIIGFAEACRGLGRLSEAQAALDKAALLNGEDTKVDLALARLHGERAWSLFVGEENRFSTASFLEILRSGIRRAPSARLAAAANELERARKLMDRHASEIESSAALRQQRATFRSFAAALQQAFELARLREFGAAPLSLTLFPAEALEDLTKAAELSPDNPKLLAIATFAEVARQLITASNEGDDRPDLRHDTRARVIALCRQLQIVAESGTKTATDAEEILGCTQLFALNDSSGAERTFRATLQKQAARARAWDLLALAAFRSGDRSRLVEICEERSVALPNAQSSVMLIRSYEDHGDPARAEWNALLASFTYPSDFHVNLCLAALLLRHEEFGVVSSRAGDALNIAEKQLNQGSPLQQHLDFVAVKAIYLGMSERSVEARALLQPYLTAGKASGQLQEILRALESEE